MNVGGSAIPWEGRTARRSREGTIRRAPRVHPKVIPARASSPGAGSKKGFMMRSFQPQPATNSMATSCPPTDYVSKAENILKIKGRKRAFL